MTGIKGKTIAVALTAAMALAGTAYAGSNEDGFAEAAGFGTSVGISAKEALDGTTASGTGNSASIGFAHGISNGTSTGSSIGISGLGIGASSGTSSGSSIGSPTPDVEASREPSEITTTGKASATGVPDSASFEVTVRAEAKDSAEAMAKCSDKANEIMAAMTDEMDEVVLVEKKITNETFEFPNGNLDDEDFDEENFDDEDFDEEDFDDELFDEEDFDEEENEEDDVEDDGISERIRTISVDVWPQFDYDNPEETKITGYEATTTFEASDLGFEEAGRLLNVAVENGADSVGDLKFSCGDYEFLYEEALSQAIERATEKAETMAEAAGMSVIRLKTAVEGYEDDSMNATRSIKAYSDEANSEGPVSPLTPGVAEISASVTATFEIG